CRQAAALVVGRPGWVLTEREGGRGATAGHHLDLAGGRVQTSWAPARPCSAPFAVGSGCLRAFLWWRPFALKGGSGNVDDARVFPSVALKARRAGLIGLAIFAGAADSRTASVSVNGQ